MGRNKIFEEIGCFKCLKLSIFVKLFFLLFYYVLLMTKSELGAFNTLNLFVHKLNLTLGVIPAVFV